MQIIILSFNLKIFCKYNEIIINKEYLTEEGLSYLNILAAVINSTRTSFYSNEYLISFS